MNDIDLLRQIAQGGGFDQVEAVRLIARIVTDQAANKQAPNATMDAPGNETANEPEAATASKRKKSAPQGAL